METTKIIENKQTVYLDQNILDVLTKHKVDELRKPLTEDLQVVYSDETLKEIRRSKGFESNFLYTLKTLNAKHLKVDVEHDFTMTNRASITERNPFDAYNEYCYRCDESISNGMENSLFQFLFKLNGGRPEDSLNTIVSDIHIKLLEQLDMAINHSGDLPKHSQDLLKKMIGSIKKELPGVFDNFENLMLECGQDGRHLSWVEKFRSEIGFGPKELNNIEPPNVLIQIWEKLSSSPSLSQSNIDIDEFFKLKENPLNPSEPYYNHQKVTTIYNMLNFVGYYPDSKMHKERRFIAASSDNNHASMASFCDFLLSHDDSFIKKTKAAFEYLGISTKAIYVNFT